MAQCKWPIGDPRAPDFRFCPAVAVDGRPYCREHMRIAYEATPSPGKVKQWVALTEKAAQDGRR